MGVDRLGTLDIQLDLFADHHFRQRSLAGVCGFNRADVFALAQNRNAVGNFQHFVELMGDNDDGFPILAHIAHDVKELFGFLRSQNGGRLVENQNLRTAIEHFDDFKRLLLTDAHLIDLLI